MTTGPGPTPTSSSSTSAASPSVRPTRVSLRPVTPDDLATLFTFQLDPESNRMAAVRPRTHDVFMARWAETLEDPNAMARAIEADGTLAGSIGCFLQDMPWGGKQYAVGYAVGRPFWGRGVATRALGLLLEELKMRPIHARAAEDNIASRRVLERNGFKEVTRYDSPETERYLACVEVVMRLD